MCKKFLAVFISAVMVFSVMIFIPDSASRVSAAANPAGVRRNVMVGYYHVFKNGAANGLMLRDVDPTWDVIELSFGEPSDGAGNVIFNPMTDSLYNSEEEFADDVAFVQSRGQKVCLSIGGQNGKVSLTTPAQADTFYNTVTGIIDKYNLDGFDIDFEGSSIRFEAGDNNLKNPTSPTVVNLINATKRICAKYDDSFILTMAPETLLLHNGVAFYGGNNFGDSRNGVYLPVIDALRDDLSWVQAQYYNTANAYTIDQGSITSGTVYFDVVLLDMLLEGFYVAQSYTPENIGNPDMYFAPLRPDQVVLGVPAGASAAGAGKLSIDGYLQVMDLMINGGTVNGYTVKNPSKNFRGIMTWSINWDVFYNKSWSAPVSAFLETANKDISLVVTQNPAVSSIDCGTSILYTATAAGENLGNVTYKFEVLKGSEVVHTQNSSSNTLNYTYRMPGIYSVRVTSTAAQASDVFETDEITVNAVALSLSAPTVSKSQNGSLTWSCTAQGTGDLLYNFDIYSGDTLVSSSGLGASSSYSYTPQISCEVKAVVTVKDSLNQQAAARGGIVWYSHALRVENFTPSRVNNTVTVSVPAFGGTGDYSYSIYVVKGGRVYCKSAYSSSKDFSFPLSDSGTYTVYAYVNDGNNSRASNKVNLTI